MTERIEAERLVEADQEVVAFQKLTLMEKLTSPKNVRSPVSAAVMVDGGRYQRCEKNESEDGDRRTHWFEDKAGFCLELGGRRDDVAASPDAVDPCPLAKKPRKRRLFQKQTQAPSERHSASCRQSQ